MTDESLMNKLADQYQTALLSGNVTDLDTILAPTFVNWYNYTAEISRDEALRFFGTYFKETSVRFRDIKRHPTPTGWVEEHLVDADGDGFSVRGLAACLVITLDGERIARVAEYLDSASISAFDASQMKT